VDEIDAYRLKALDSMTETVDSLSDQIRKAQSSMNRARPPEQSAPDKNGASLRK
jgi:hypothetical protein